MKKVEVYTKDYCPYCVSVKELFDSLGLEYNEIEINSQEEMQKLIEKSGMMTVPQVFIGGELIGGYDDTKALHDAGDLVKKIEE